MKEKGKRISMKKAWKKGGKEGKISLRERYEWGKNMKRKNNKKKTGKKEKNKLKYTSQEKMGGKERRKRKEKYNH